MVFFTCNACGESLKKAQVDKHVNMCRGCQMLSCIDCGKDFWGEDYKNHIKCITEDQKYGGKGFEAKSNKGEFKQQQWIQRIHEAMNKQGVNAMLKDILNQVSSYDNVPRKKAKFQNWMKNSLKILNPTLHAQVWDIFSATTDNPPEVLKKTEEPKHPVSENKAETNGSQPTYQNGAPEELAPDKKKLNKRERKEARQKKSGKIKKSQENDGSKDQQEEANKGKAKKRKRSSAEEGGVENGHTGEWTSTKKQKKTKDSCEDNQDTEVAEELTEQSHSEAGSKEHKLIWLFLLLACKSVHSNIKCKFNWKGTIKAVLRQSPEEGLSVKKLRKKVLAAYYSCIGEKNFKSEEEVCAIFNKKISNNPKFRVLKDKVRLIN
ncbi:cell growth-regulating nucleolar protein isoform X2 [Hypomesus transpacificus]|uniref:cell growth-regulating nucleolar protein isoform X2 n=1 Tax=Hypomesus transpacificus TaxID=137520 RepID=UPI001F087686|nr:cell growth-regulating nucleolar protein isoform X2 [Hypomesus transpacificus]